MGSTRARLPSVLLLAETGDLRTARSRKIYNTAAFLRVFMSRGAEQDVIRRSTPQPSPASPHRRHSKSDEADAHKRPRGRLGGALEALDECIGCVRVRVVDLGENNVPKIGSRLREGILERLRKGRGAWIDER